jgi:hypothetical protein
MYENRHGRFTTVDPLLASGKSANPQTFNRYVYVTNSPLAMTDPTGLFGDYWSRSGKYLGSDGKRDWKNYFATETRQDETSTWIDANSIEEASIRDVIRAARNSGPVTPGPTRAAEISAMSAEVVQGVKDGSTGIAKGVGNAPAVALNGITGSVFDAYAFSRGTNPLAIPLPFEYTNARERSYGTSSSAGTIAGFGVAGGTIFGGSSVGSVVPEANTELTVFRVFGGDSRAQGFSWTTTNPTSVNNFRNAAGLPSGAPSGSMNTADFMIQGRVNPANIIESRPAFALDGNAGGLPELIIAPENVTITGFRVLNP